MGPGDVDELSSSLLALLGKMCSLIHDLSALIFFFFSSVAIPTVRRVSTTNVEEVRDAEGVIEMGS